MLIFDDGDYSRAINLDNIEIIHVDDGYDRSFAYLNFDDCSLKFGSRAEAEFTLADIVDAYEQGKKVYRIVRGRTA